jgi:hypothetical protein
VKLLSARESGWIIGPRLQRSAEKCRKKLNVPALC